MKKLLLVLVSVSLIAGACSGSEAASSTEADIETAESPSATDSTSPADEGDGQVDEEGEADDEGGDSAATEPAPTTARAANDEPSDEDAGAGSLASTHAAAVQAVADASDWCEAADEVEEGTEILDEIDFTDPSALEQGYRQAQAVIEASRGLAPSEIAADVEVSIDGFNELTMALADADWSFLDFDLAVVERLDAQMQTATYNIERYNFDVCGVGSDPGAPPVLDEDSSNGDGEELSGTVREQALQRIIEQGFTEQEAACIVDGLDFANPEALSDVGAIIAVFTECDIGLERLAELSG